MLRNLGSLLAAGALALMGCQVGGGDGGGGGGMPDAPAGPPPVDGPEPTALCTAQLTLAGTFTPTGTLDPLLGCQPQGTWEITATVSDQGACANVPLKASYSYTLMGTGRDTTIAYAMKGTAEEFQANVVATGSGGCEGGFEHILPDGNNFDQVNLHAFLPKPMAADTQLAITGTGEFELWAAHP
jgi:hypothetical protein